MAYFLSLKMYAYDITKLCPFQIYTNRPFLTKFGTNVMPLEDTPTA